MPTFRLKDRRTAPDCFGLAFHSVKVRRSRRRVATTRHHCQEVDRMFRAVITAVLLTFAATPPGQLAHGAEQTPARTAFQQAIGDLWKDAQISGDDAYRNAFAYANPGAIAP